MNPLILYDNALTRGTLSSSTLDSGYDVQSIKDQRPYTHVKFDAAGTNYIRINCDTAEDVDCLGVCGHNLFTVGATLQLQGSNDGSNWNPVTGGSITPTDDNAFMLKFTKVTAAYFKIVITNTLGLPYLGVCFIGEALQMEWPPDGPRSPIDESINADVAESKAGNMLGASVYFNPKEMNHIYGNLTRSWVQTYFDPFWETAKQLNKFFYALDLTNEPKACGLCRLKKEYVKSTPASTLVYYDTLQLNMDVER